MSNRGRKRGPQVYGSGRGDRGSLNGGRPISSRNLSHFEGAYKNKHLVHAIISLIGCVVEVHKHNGEVYQGVLRTISPQVEVVLEAACQGCEADKPLSKSSIIQTLVVPWYEVVTVSSLSNNNTKDIFKIDSEIGLPSNGVTGNRELQPFEFDADVDDTGELDDIESSGWAPQDMFDTNESKFKVTSSFNPEMPEYTTSLELQDSEEDQKRLKEAERKAREIESEAMTNHGIDDVGTEEEKFSAVVITSEDKQEVRNDSWNGSGSAGVKNENETVVVKNDNETVDVKNETEPMIKDESEANNPPLPPEPLANNPPLPPEPLKEVMSETPQIHTADDEELIEKTTETGSEAQETHSQAVLDEEPKKSSFKLNPDAMEFKPSMGSTPTPTVASTSPPTSHVSTYSVSRGPRQKGPRGPRPPYFSEQQQSVYGYHLPIQAGGIRSMIHPQAAAAAATQLPAHLTPPTSLVVRQPLTPPIIAPHGGQALYTSIAQSPIGQQVFMPASQPAAIFGHTHHSMGPALPQSPVMYLQSPVHPHSFGQQGFIPPPQLGGSTAGLMGFPQQQVGKQ